MPKLPVRPVKARRASYLQLFEKLNTKLNFFEKKILRMIYL